MAYNEQLIFFEKLMKNIHIQCLILSSADETVPDYDMGFRKIIGVEFDFNSLTKNLFNNLKENKIYRVTDEFYCNYFTLKLPNTQPEQILLVGPFMTDVPKQNLLLELCEKFSIPPQHLGHLQKAFSYIPTLLDEAILITAMHTLGETLWGDLKIFIRALLISMSLHLLYLY